MRTLPAGFASHLSGRATTLCHAWILRRRDGLVLGFTDHDRSIAIGAVACEPASGFDRTAATSHGDLAVGEEEISGGLTSELIREDDIAAGLWDGATVEVYVANWQDAGERLLLRKGTLGEIRRSDNAFRAEVRGAAEKLDVATGRVYGRSCDANLGDSRCKVALTGFTVTGTVAASAEAGRFRVSGIGSVATGYYTNGSLTFTSGDLAGQSVVIGDHIRDATGTTLVPWRPLLKAPQAGDEFTLVAGCDKQFSTCGEKFSNTVNFRGFPHMPGRDFVFSYARGEGRDDGSVLA